MADEAEMLRKLYAKRETIVTAGRVAEAAAARGDRSATLQAEKLFDELKLVDLRITRLEATNGTIQ
ncbi:hypothetical protein [uncultured Sphingomonas sp.]|uniref:hypothetical protein n=1 Tax=uncultured Sphingomonas sp. TaxID=158754 RepID=UPI0035CB1334